MIRFRNKYLLLVALVLCFSAGKNLSAQASLKIMYYNILNFPGSTPERSAYFRTATQFINADIILVNEMVSDEGAIMLLDEGLNVYGNAVYKKAEFTDGPDSDNMLFYDSTKVTLYAQSTINTELRYINEYVLFYNDLETDTIFFYLYSAHLKSSTGSANEQKRLAEVREFKAWVDNIPEAENIFFGGDFNFYDSSEPAYDTLVNFGEVKLNDPLLAGNWHDNTSYSNIHSQSTRTDQFGGGASGGLDDRFDFILFSDDVKYGLNGVEYIPNSCRSIGNDGDHLNKSIVEIPTNSSVPDSVLQALYNMSDHLPVICEVELTVPTSQKEIMPTTLNVEIYPNPTSGNCVISFDKVLDETELILTNSLGKVVLKKNIFAGQNQKQEKLDLSGLTNGLYYLNITGDVSFMSKKIILLK